MRKETYTSRTIEGKDVTINGDDVTVIRVTCYARGYDGRKKDIYDIQTSERHYIMYTSEFSHLCRCHWVDYEW